MCKTAVLLTILMMLPTLAFGGAGQPRALTARQAFALIPTEIFENTRFPAEDNRDTLRFASADGLPDVCLRMFRSERGSVAAFRTEDDDGVCISELWYISSGGHAAPLPLPPEPDIGDFFRPDRDLPGRLSSSCTYCVFDKGLEVLPSFTSDGFPCELDPDNAVYYLWNGHTFVKRVKKAD